MTYLLDTSAWVAHYRSETGGERVRELLAQTDSQFLVASVSVTEFARLLKTLDAKIDTETVIGNYLSMFDAVVPVDLSAAKRASELSAAATARLPLADSLIAAAASVTGATLVHRDAHFTSIPKRLLKQLYLT